MALPHHIPGSHNDTVHRENREKKRDDREKKTFTTRTRLNTEKNTAIPHKKKIPVILKHPFTF